MADMRDWSTTASSNTDLFPENMAPSAVNDGGRTVQAELAQIFKDEGGTLTTAGTATAYTLTLNTQPASLADGLFFSFTAHATNTGAATLTVTGASAFSSKKLRKITPQGEVDLVAGDLVINGHYLTHYDSAADSGTGAYLVLNPNASSHVPVETGTVSAAAQKDIALPTGYQKVIIELDNIVPATSGAQLLLRVSIDNGATYKTDATGYKYAHYGYIETNTFNSAASTGSNSILVIGGMGTTYSAVSTITIPNPASATTPKNIRIQSEYLSSSSTFSTLYGVGAYSAANSAITHVRLLMNTGNIASMNYRVIGVR